jgi:dephospho-CoA kinase
VKRVALTGGIATGKTHVARRLAGHHDVPVVDSDEIVHEALATGGALVGPVIDRFGEGVRASDGGINRRALGAIVFEDPAARGALERLVHPHVYDRIARWFAALDPAAAFAVADIPLLFETGHESDFDAIIVTACDPATQIERVIKRDGVTREDAERRVAAQWPIHEKVARATHVVRTDGTTAETDRQVEGIVTKLGLKG